jgi:hypothetical protein
VQEVADVEKGKGGELIVKEDQEVGQIGYKVYWWVASAGLCAKRHDSQTEVGRQLDCPVVVLL